MRKLVLLIIFFMIAISYAMSESEKIFEKELPGKMVFASERTDDGDVYIFLIENGKLEKLPFHSNSARFSPDGKMLSLVGRKEISIYNLEKRKIEKTFKLKNKHYYDSAWTRDGKYIIYGVKEEINKEKKLYNTYLMRLEVKSGKEKILRKWENVGFWYNITDFFISNDNKRLLLAVGNTSAENIKDLNRVYVMDLNGKNEKEIWILGKTIGWYPDNKNILIHTNRNKEGEGFNKFRGSLLKIDVDTLEVKTIQSEIKDKYVDEFLTRDGKYVYSVRYFPNPHFAYCIVLAQADKLEKREENEIMITYPVTYTYGGAIKHNEDSSPDWYYE
jgi:hypothetical protein